MDSPDDNTAVIRMKRDFDVFMSTNGGPNLGNYGMSRSLLGGSSRSKSSLSVQLLLEKEAKLKEADVIAAKSKITELESQLCISQTSRKKARVEYEKDIETKTHEQEIGLEKMKELKNQLQFISQRETHTKDELAECQHQLDNRKVSFEKKCLALQKENQQLQDELQQTKDNTWEKIKEMRNELQRSQTELGINQSELDKTKSQLKLQNKKLLDTTTQLDDLEECRLKAMQSEETIKDLEMKVSRYEEDAMLNRTMKTQISSWEQLEKDYENLKEKNLFLKETEENNMLLKEQFEGMKKKLERAEDRFAEIAAVELENEELKSRLEKWELAENNGSRIQSPAALGKRLADLQASQLIMLEENGHLQSSLHSKEELLKDVQEQHTTTVSDLAREKVKCQQQAELVKRLQRKLLLVTKEREGFKHILDSYESELTVNITSNTASRIQLLENTLQMYRKQTEQLEVDLEHRAEDQNKAIAFCQKAEQQSRRTSNAASPIIDSRTAIHLREKIAKLEKELEQKEEAISILETRIEQRHLQGDYDPTKTKIVHFSMNPASIAQNRRMEELSRIKVENEKLQQRVKLLEDSGGKVEDLTFQVDQKLKEPSTSKEVEEIKAQLSTAELKNKRLMEAFKKKSQEFREVCYQLLGYRIDMPSDNQYRLISMYSEAPTDYLLFQQSSSGEIQMLGTDFSGMIQEFIDEYLGKMNSIPAFLSKLTLDLFGRQTITWD